jgi:hypothetical protein
MWELTQHGMAGKRHWQGMGELALKRSLELKTGGKPKLCLGKPGK